MSSWPKHPVLYEINTWVWLAERSAHHRRPVTLASVPPEEWDRIAEGGFDAVWLMGVWERSPAGIAISMRNSGLLEDFKRALPDFTAADNVGSPYCVRRYVVDDLLGGPQGLAIARAMLRERGIGLILDFVPNHVAPDHPWTARHPERFIQGSGDDLRDDPASYMEIGGSVFARGRDPYYPAWPDVIQLNAFHPELRRAAVETLAEIASQCDGVRCDMAMLMLNSTFHRIWGERAGAVPDEDFWRMVIPAVRSRWPGFRFIAEVYWDLQWELQQQGFDHCYDKKTYDRMEHGDNEGLHQHLRADPAYQQGLVRFIENHDEPRAAAAFPGDKGRAAAVALLTLPGARLLHEGQLEGRTVRLPVFLARRPVEMPDPQLGGFYRKLLLETRRDIFRNGEWQLCERHGWPGNSTCHQLLAWCWRQDEERFLVVINFHPASAQARIALPWDELRGRRWRLDDLLSEDAYERSGDEMRDGGLYFELGPWRAQLFQVGGIPD